jgi:hypothetical protein
MPGKTKPTIGVKGTCLFSLPDEINPESPILAH